MVIVPEATQFKFEADLTIKNSATANDGGENKLIKLENTFANALAQWIGNFQAAETAAGNTDFQLRTNKWEFDVKTTQW